MTEVITTPEAEVVVPTDVPSEQKEQTIGEVLDTTPKEPEKPATVGLDKFLEEKKGRKEAEKRIKELEAKINDGATAEEISGDLSELADEYNVDKSFLSKLEKKLESRLESKMEGKLKPITDKENAEKIDKVFNQHFNKTIEQMPEFANIVNSDVIKQLSLNPKNSGKTFQQLIEETYGNALGGKRTLDTSIPRGGKEPTEVDFDRAKKDTEYFKEVMSNPSLKSKYNNGLASRLGL